MNGYILWVETLGKEVSEDNYFVLYDTYEEAHREMLNEIKRFDSESIIPEHYGRKQLDYTYETDENGTMENYEVDGKDGTHLQISIVPMIKGIKHRYYMAQDWVERR